MVTSSIAIATATATPRYCTPLRLNKASVSELPMPSHSVGFVGERRESRASGDAVLFCTL
jgi:hypothetical protein